MTTEGTFFGSHDEHKTSPPTNFPNETQRLPTPGIQFRLRTLAMISNSQHHREVFKRDEPESNRTGR